ncbi:MAG TPA: 2-oxoacid:acceptor oxidoreductase subunit alpha [Peptococcaceae bacterium]|nr:2-oxoacid:acceptor oxidoreductase subunit alpha [Peptococcaceae bacterium]
MFIQGNEACALGAINAGARFFAGYPISPVNELSEFCSRELPKLGGIFIQMEDEIGGLAAVIGASLGGMKAFTATSGPGFSLMQENLGFAVMAEVPCVLISVQRYGLCTGVATKPGQQDIMQARWGTHGDHPIIALVPSTVQECFDLTVQAFNLSERFSSPVLVLTDAALAHLRERVIIKDEGELNIINRKTPSVSPEEYLPYSPDVNGIPTLAPYGGRHILRVTGLFHDERGFSTSNPEKCRKLLERLHSKILNHQKELPPPKYYGKDGAEIILISYGISARSAREAAERGIKKGINMGMINLQTVWPFPEEHIMNLCDQAEKIFVVELNMGQITGEVQKIFKGKAEVMPILRYDTNVITPSEILDKIESVVK